MSVFDHKQPTRFELDGAVTYERERHAAEVAALREELATARATVAVFEESLAAVLKTRPATVKERAAAYVPMAMLAERLREQHAAAERAFALAMAENERLQRDLTAAEMDRDDHHRAGCACATCFCRTPDEVRAERDSLREELATAIKERDEAREAAILDVVQARCERDQATRALVDAVVRARAEEREACRLAAMTHDPDLFDPQPVRHGYAQGRNDAALAIALRGSK